MFNFKKKSSEYKIEADQNRTPEGTSSTEETVLSEVILDIEKSNPDPGQPKPDQSLQSENIVVYLEGLRLYLMATAYVRDTRSRA